ncbi:MAG: hypothetical protein R3F56_06345 [Planctomycetota bacterium]
MHEDPRIGIKIKVPDKWTMVPIDIDEKWIVAKYLCNRDYVAKTAYVGLKPEMRIIHFTPEKAEVKERVETHGDTTYSTTSKTFRNYKEWFKEDIKGSAGFHIDSEKEDKLGDVAVTKISILTDQGANGAMRYLCWIYARPDGSTVAVDFVQLEDYFKNVEDDFEKSLRSMRFFEPTVNASSAGDDELENPMWTRDRSKWRAMPKTERWKIRQSMDVKRRNKVLANIPDGWTTQESRSKRFTALTHADKKYTSLVLDTADATWDWLDKRFGDLSDEYVMVGTIRICKDADEASAYTRKSATGDSYSDDDREIVDYKDRDAGSSGGGQRSLMRGLLQAYLYDKDWYAGAYAPDWALVSMSYYLASGEVSGRKLVFKSDNTERMYIREAERAGALRTFSEIISTPSEDWPKERDAYRGYVFQVATIVRFLESREASRLKCLDKFIPRYTQAVIKAGEQWAKDHPGQSQAKSEEEEEARAKDRSKQRRERAQFILNTVNKEVANFSQKEWQQIEATWKKWLTR